MEINTRKIRLEASATPKIRAIFKNMANDAENLYRKNGSINTQELANNYYPEFLKEIRDLMRRTNKEFKNDFRNYLVNITDPNKKDKLNDIDLSINEASTYFVANESERQAKYITETNAKEIELAIKQEELKSTTQKALPEWIIIARNIRVNLLDKSPSRTDLIAAQVVGLTESWTRQKEAQLTHDSRIEVNQEPIEALKTWVAILDSRTRESHVEADFQQVGVNNKFIVGGFEADFPRDPNLPANEVINCRCIVDYSNKFGR